MWYKKLKEWFHFDWLFDIYIPTKPIEDSYVPVVKLRNDIVDLIEGRILHITGATGINEAYLFIKSNDRYILVRTHKGKSREYTFFQQDWPASLNVIPKLVIATEGFEIRGSPYKITKDSDELGRIVLKLER
jgi:hypothetical protein